MRAVSGHVIYPCICQLREFEKTFAADRAKYAESLPKSKGSAKKKKKAADTPSKGNDDDPDGECVNVGLVRVIRIMPVVCSDKVPAKDEDEGYTVVVVPCSLTFPLAAHQARDQRGLRRRR
jgi:hypothetical protein